MPFIVACPHCQDKYKIKDHKKGRKVRCRSCEKTFRAGAKTAEDTKRPDDTKAPAWSSPFLDLNLGTSKESTTSISSSPFLDLNLD